MESAFKQGQYIEMMGHNFIIRGITSIDGVNRISLTCAPHCCMRPFNVKMQFEEDSLKKILEAKRL